jgi:hypothetical protein
MSRYIPDALRTVVANRADFRCEYCRVYSSASFFSFHIDHVVSLKHGGQTNADNLAYACPVCNLNKGPDVATFLDDITAPVRLFNPRIDYWNDHFIAEQTGFLTAQTDIGAATIKILNLNHPDSIIERREMVQLGIF